MFSIVAIANCQTRSNFVIHIPDFWPTMMPKGSLLSPGSFLGEITSGGYIYTLQLFSCINFLQARQFVEMEYSYNGEPVRKASKLPSPICTPSGSPISSSVSLAGVCDEGCYNRNSYAGKCMKRTRSVSEPAHQHENAFSQDHMEMNDIKGKHKANSKPHNDKQPNNVTTSAIVTMPDFETVAVPNNIHEGTANRRYENCNNRRGSHNII